MENKYDMDAIFGNKPTTADADVDKKPKYDMDAIFGDKSDKSKALESRVKVNISEAVKQDPLAVFKSKTLSQSLGLPQDVTFRNLKEVEANAKSQEWEAAIAKSPTLKKLTADPYFAGVSFKDDALPEVEKLFREKGFAAASERRNKAIQDRKTMLNEAMSGYREDTASTLGSIGAGLAIDLPSGIVYGGGAAVFETAGEWLDRTGLIGTLLPANPLSMAGEKFRELGNRAKATADALSGETNSTSPMVQGWYSGWRSFGSNAPALIGSVLTRNPKLALESLTAMVGGQEYLKAREEGKAPTESAAFATSQAFIERATEGIPLDTLFRNLRSGKGFLNTFAVNQVQEQIGEQAATVLQDLNDWAFLNPEKTFKQYLDERPSAAAQTAIATLVGSGAQTIIAQAVENTGNFLSTKQEKARFAEDNAKAMEQLFNFANTSALKGIDAKSFEQLVQASADDNAGTPSELYIDGRVFKQLADEAGVDLNTMPTIAAQLEDAINNQTDIIAPIGELTTGLANTGLESQVIENLKYEEDGLTIAESRVVFEQSKEMFKAEVDRTLATQEEKNFFEQKADEIYQNIFKQLQEVKRNTKDANDVYAELIKQFYSTEAKQQSAASGTVVTADMVFASLPAFKVVGESPITGKVYDQESPEFKSWFGESKIIDKTGKPLVVYHGTKADFDAFDLNKIGQNGLALGPSFYFTDSKSVAEGWGNPRAFYLSVKNPTLSAEKRTITKSQVKSIIKKLEKEDEYFLSNYGDVGYEGYANVLNFALSDVYDGSKNDAEILASLINIGGVERNKVMQTVIDVTGKDGMVADAAIASNAASGGEKIYTALIPTQIKSVDNLGTFDPNNPNVYKQDQSPIFYSALYQGIDKANLKDMPASQWKSWLAGNAPKLGIKKEEIEWTGLNEYFDLRGKDKLSKQDVINYLNNNGVVVEETTLGDTSGTINYNSRYAIPEVVELARVSQGTNDYALVMALENNYEAYQALSNKFPDLMENEDWAQIVAMEVTGGYSSAETATRHHDWQLDGGEDYRELLLMLPTSMEAYNKFSDKLRQKYGKGGFDNLPLTEDERFTLDRLIDESGKKPFVYETHWNQKNVLAHVRFNSRIDADGKRVLFIEEIQSDWAQKGREEGFIGDDVTEDQIDFRFIEPSPAVDENGNPRNGHWELYYKDTGAFILRERGVYSKEEVAVKALRAINEQMFRGHTPAAFVTDTKSWLSLATKRIMRYAADNNFDKVAFINGEQSADRYNLSKKLDSIG